jgi:putative oxidoreductase
MLDSLHKYRDQAYVLLRVVAGLMFAQHGLQKLFGWFGSNAVELMSLRGFAGVIELVAGLAIAVGLLTRISAIGGIIVMIGALATVHFPNGAIPIVNKGELALLYLVVFVLLLTKGPGRWSLDEKLWKRE